MSDRTQKIPEGCPEGQQVRRVRLGFEYIYGRTSKAVECLIAELAPLPEPSEREPEPEIVSRTSPSPLAALYETEEWKSAWDGEPSEVTDTQRPRSISYIVGLLKRLRDIDYATKYLLACSDDPKTFAIAVRDFAAAMKEDTPR